MRQTTFTGFVYSCILLTILFSTSFAQIFSWEKVSFPVANITANSFAIAPAGTIYVGTDTVVYSSSDTGKNWIPINGPTHVNALIIDPWGFVFAGADSVYKFNRLVWTSANSGLIASDRSPNVYAFAINSSGLLAGVGTVAGNFGGIFLNPNTSSSSIWSPLDIRSGIIIRTLVINSSGIIFAGGSTGVYRSTDNGMTWGVNHLPNSENTNALALNSNDHLYAGTNGGLFCSTDSGNTWLYKGLPSKIYSLAINYLGQIFAGTDFGIISSADSGKNWTYELWPATDTILSVLIKSDGRMFAGTKRNGIYRSKLLPPPLLVSPTNGSQGIGLTPSLSWQIAPKATSYNLQIATTSNFNSPLINQIGLADTMFTLSSVLTNNVKYYWRVAAVYPYPYRASDWSAAWSFTTLQSPPAIPSLVSPNNLASNIALSPALTWGASSGAATYHIQLSTSATFANYVVDDSSLTTTIRAVGPLTVNRTYYWRVNAKSVGGTSAYTPVWSFTTTIATPVAPVLLSPPSAASNISLTPILTWGASNSATIYHVQASLRSAAFSNIVVDDSTIATTYQVVNPLTSNAVYYWRVNASNVGGSSAWSAIWNFTTIPPVPNQVTLLSPSYASIITVDSVGFRWNKAVASVNVNKYCLEIFTDSLLNSRLIVDSTIVDTFTVRKYLSNSPTYWWRVKAHNISGWGNVSELSKFVIDLPVVALFPAKFTCILTSVAISDSYVKYGLPSTSKVSIRLYNIQGKLLKILCNTNQQAGYYQISINSSLLSKGCYLLDFRAGNFTAKRIVNHF